MAYNAAGEGDLDRVFITNAELVDQYVGEKLYTWGYNGYGQLGNNSSGTNLSSPGTVAGLGSTWSQISCGYQSIAAVKTDGTLWTWGNNSYGMLGDGTTTGRSSPGTVAGGGTNWSQSSITYRFSAAVKTDGTLWTWGRNAEGQLGDGTTSSRSSPVTTSGGGNNWKLVSVGGNDGTTAAIKTDGTLWTWGYQNQGMLGDWTAGTQRTSPAVVVGPPTLTDASINRQIISLTSTTSPTTNDYIKKFDTKTIYFDGTSNLTVPMTSTSVPYGTENFTIEGWIYPTTTSGGNRGVYSSGTNANDGISISWLTSGTINVYIFGNSIAAGTGLTPINKWCHVSFTRSSGVFRLFINGSLISTDSSRLTLSVTPTSSPSKIGNDNVMATVFTGYMDQFRVIKGVAKYTASFTPSLYPMFDPISADPYYSNVSLLLKADDVVNAANNNTFVDNSGNNLAITRNGNTTQGSFSPFAVEPGKWSNYFDGNGDYLSRSFTSTTDGMYLQGNTYTIEAFVYMTSTSGTQQIYVCSATNTGNFGLMNLVVENGVLYFTVRPTTGGVQSFASGGTVVANQWTHVAASVNSGSLKIFINGIEVGSATISTASFIPVGAAIGRVPNGYTTGITDFTGYISNLRIVQGTALYTSNFTPSTVPLTAVAGTSLLTCQDNRFVDNSINNSVITPAGDVKPVPTSPFSKNTDILAPYFSTANTDYLSVSNNNVFNMGSSDFTVECWFYPTSIPANADNASHLITLSQDPISGASSWSFGLGYGGTAANNLTSFGFAYVGGSGSTCSGTAKLSLNTWTHVAMVRSGSTVYLYQNGVQVASAAISGSLNFDSSYTVKIGRSSSSPTRYFYGHISDARIVNGTAVYTSAFTPPTQPLKAIANTSLLTCQSDTVDNSSNRFTVTKNGNVNVMPVVPYESPTGNSVYFNSVSDYITTPSSSTLNAGTGNFTVEFWVKSIDNFAGGNGQEVFIIGNPGTLNGMQIGIWPGYISIYSLGDSTYNYSFKNETWYHVAVSRSSGTLSIYINGTYIGGGNYSTRDLNSSGPVKITGVTNNAGKCYVSNLRYVVGTALYTANFTPSTLPLAPITNTVLLTCQDKVIKDNSSNNFALTVAGSATPSLTGPFKPSDYYYGGSMYFDGTGDYLSIPDSTLFDLAGTNYTIELWVYPIAYTSEAVLIGQNDYGTAGEWDIRIISGVKIRWADTAGASLIDSVSAIPLLSWTHVAVSSNGSTTTLYINGVSQGTTSTAFTNSTRLLGVGAGSNGNAPLNGYLSNVRIVKGTQVYTAAFTPPTKPALPVTNTSLLLSGTNAGIVDSTGRNNLETVGTAQISTNYRKWNTGSMYFDGSGSSVRIPGSQITIPGDFTLEFWFYRALASHSTEVLFDFNANAANGLFVRLNTAGADDIYVGGSNLTSVMPWVKQQTWQHLAICRESGVVSIFVDGVKRLTGNNSATIGGSGTLSIGYYIAGNQVFNGYIDDLRITNGVARYTKNFSVTTKPLAKIDSGATSTSLLTCQSSTIVDNSTNAFALTSSGATVSSYAPFLGTNSVSFSSGYVKATNNAALLLGKSDFTLECWIKATATSQSHVCGTAIINSGAGAYMIWTNGTTIQFYCTTDGTTSTRTDLSYSTTSFVNSWMHVAVCRSGNTLNMFINGTLQVTTTFTGTIFADTRDFYIGASAGNSSYFPGNISNVRLVKGQALYTSNFTLSDVPNPPVRSLPSRYVAPDANYSSVGMQMNPNEIVNLDYSGNWKQVSVGGSHVMGIKNDGTLWAWGLNNRGQMADPAAGGAVPKLNQYGYTWKSVSCGGTNSAMVRSDGTLWTCGYNNYGANGDGTTSNRSSPVTTLAGGTNWKSVSVGGMYIQEAHMVAVKTDGTLWSWGANARGQLGDGTSVNRSSPVQVVSGNISNWKTASAAYTHTAGIAQD